MYTQSYAVHGKKGAHAMHPWRRVVNVSERSLKRQFYNLNKTNHNKPICTCYAMCPTCICEIQIGVIHIVLPSSIILQSRSNMYLIWKNKLWVCSGANRLVWLTHSESVIQQTYYSRSMSGNKEDWNKDIAVVFGTNKANDKALIDGLAQDCNDPIANALQLLQACTKPLICIMPYRLYQ